MTAPLRARSMERLAWLLIIAFALWLRSFQLGDQILIDDELHSLAKLTTSDYRGIATSLGLLDHSIPLTLFYKWIALQGWLSEASMRALPWLAGVCAATFAAIVARHHALRTEALLFGALVAGSPLLVLFTRQARPYAITLFFGLVAVWAAWRWSRSGRRGYVFLHLGTGALAAWFHPIVVPFVFGVWAFFLMEWLAGERRDTRRLGEIVGWGVLAGALTVVLLLPAVLDDWTSIRHKIGSGHATFRSAWRTMHTLSGTGSTVLLVVMLALAMLGTASLWRRYRRATRFALTLVGLQVACVLASGAAWLDHALVLSRYTLLCLPFLLFAVSAGFALCAQWVFPQRPAIAATAGVALLAALYASGPLPAALTYPNAFFEHYIYFLDFDPRHNEVVPYLASGPMPAFYKELGNLPPASRTLIEAPWRFESSFNRQPYFQRIHRQRVEIGMVGELCPPGTYGEQARTFPNRFRHFINLARPLDELRRRGDFVVFHRRLDLANLTEPWMSYDGHGLPPVDGCIEAFRKALGAPIFTDETITVFALRVRPLP